VDEARGRFDEIYEAYSGLIYAYALRRTGDPDVAGDIVGETFLVAWRKLADVPAGEQVRPWLYAVARRTLSTYRRGDQRRQRLVHRLQLDLPSHQVQTPAGEPDDRALIARAFNALGPRDQELLTLVGWDGLSNEELADTFRCSRAVVRVRLHRARRRFQRELAEVGLQRHVVSGHEPGRWAPAHPDPEEA
jgi:RNA polymerase sigma factor (sigma-70 family)